MATRKHTYIHMRLAMQSR